MWNAARIKAENEDVLIRGLKHSCAILVPTVRVLNFNRFVTVRHSYNSREIRHPIRIRKHPMSASAAEVLLWSSVSLPNQCCRTVISRNCKLNEVVREDNMKGLEELRDALGNVCLNHFITLHERHWVIQHYRSMYTVKF